MSPEQMYGEARAILQTIQRMQKRRDLSDSVEYDLFTAERSAMAIMVDIANGSRATRCECEKYQHVMYSGIVCERCATPVVWTFPEWVDSKVARIVDDLDGGSLESRKAPRVGDPGSGNDMPSNVYRLDL